MKHIKTLDQNYLRKVAANYVPINFIQGISKLTTGNINNTYLVSLFSNKQYKSFILQLVNQELFNKPIDIIHNYNVVYKYINAKIHEIDATENLITRFPKLLNKLQSKDQFLEQENNFWRAFEYCESTTTKLFLESSFSAKEVGTKLGSFQQLLYFIPKSSIKNNLENLHNTKLYLAEYEDIYSRYDHSKEDDQTSKLLIELSNYVFKYRKKSLVLHQAISKEVITMSIVHGDPKLTNFLFDSITDRIVSIIDIDTLHYGYPIIDLADCIRSCCNPGGEESTNLDKVYLDINLFSLLLNSYFNNSYKLLKESDYKYVPFAIFTITFELAIRFLIDYLSGDIYFDTNYPNHNLQRSKVQFKLLHSIESQWDDIVNVVDCFKDNL